MSRRGSFDADLGAADEAPMPSPEDIAQSQQVTQPLVGGKGDGSALASALGSAMLGLDQAIRRAPPAQVVAAEHQPGRSFASDDGDLIIEVPEPGERLMPAGARTAPED